MLFKDISYLELCQPLCSVNWNRLCNSGGRHHEEQSCEIILNLDQWLRRKCSSKGISYRELWQHFSSPDRNHLCNFGRDYYEEQFCEIILNLGRWFSRRCLLKDLSGAVAALLFSGAEPFMQF